jgi:hypothetical protein
LAKSTYLGDLWVYKLRLATGARYIVAHSGAEAQFIAAEILSCAPGEVGSRLIKIKGDLSEINGQTRFTAVRHKNSHLLPEYRQEAADRSTGTRPRGRNKTRITSP